MNHFNASSSSININAIKCLVEKPELAEVLKYLLNLPNYWEVRQILLTVAEFEHIAFTDHLVSLNVLVRYAQTQGGKRALVSLLRQVEEPFGLDLIKGDAPEPSTLREWEDYPNSPNFNPRHDYQMNYMRARRSRETKALKAKWLSLPEDHRAKYPRGIRGDARKRFTAYVHDLWQKGKANDLKDGSDSKACYMEYWAEIDRLLNLALEGDVEATEKVLGDFNLVD